MFRLSLNRVHDKVRITESGEKITLAVDGDAARMVTALNNARNMLSGITEDSTDGERREAALIFATAIFGREQANQLMAFYGDDPICVINICGKYFSERLSALISKAQKG